MRVIRILRSSGLVEGRTTCDRSPQPSSPSTPTTRRVGRQRSGAPAPAPARGLAPTRLELESGAGAPAPAPARPRPEAPTRWAERARDLLGSEQGGATPCGTVALVSVTRAGEARVVAEEEAAVWAAERGFLLFELPEAEKGMGDVMHSLATARSSQPDRDTCSLPPSEPVCRLASPLGPWQMQPTPPHAPHGTPSPRDAGSPRHGARAAREAARAGGGAQAAARGP